MKKLLILFTCVLLAFACLAQQTIFDTIMHDDLERAYILYVPVSYAENQPAPLVFNFHGYTSSAFSQMNYGDFRAIADTAGFLLVHPQGTDDLVGNPHFNVGWGGSEVDDIGFTSALIDSLDAQYNINLDQVYSTGMSNGGFMSYNLACQLGDRIAAIASVTGSMSPAMLGACEPTHPTPILEIHGTADAVVFYNGSVIAQSINSVLNYWRTYNMCSEIAIVNELTDVDSTDGSTVTHLRYADCDNGVVTEHFRINSGGHTWPGAGLNLPSTNYDIDASAEVWKFFAQYDINGRIGLTTTHQPNPDVQFKTFPNPTDGMINIELELSNSVIYNFATLSGQTLLNGTFTGDSFALDISSFPSGLYLLRMNNVAFKILKI